MTVGRVEMEYNQIGSLTLVAHACNCMRGATFFSNIAVFACNKRVIRMSFCLFFCFLTELLTLRLFVCTSLRAPKARWLERYMQYILP